MSAAALPDVVDVLIVGYGPVGAAIAGLLGRYGVQTLVVDKAESVFMAPRAIALDNEALRILQMVGLAEGAFAKAKIPFVCMRSPRLGQFARIDTAGDIDCHPKLVTFYQPELERALRTLVAQRPSVVARTSALVLRCEEDGDSVRVTLRRGEGEEEAVRARYVIGADGASSMVRGQIGLDFQGETYAEDWLIVDAMDVPGDFDHVEFLCDPARPTPHMIAPGGRARWEFMLKPGETREEMESDAKIDELLAPWTRGAKLRIERKAVYRFQARACRRFSRGRVFLVGDAAHVTPPFVGQGLVAGLRDAANLAWKLAWVLRGHASESILTSYDQERRPHAVKMIALAKFMGRLVMPQSEAKALVVHGALSLFRRLPFGRRLVDELGVKPENAYPIGLFVGGRARGLRGAWLPQARVRGPSGDVVPSDDVLGPALALVGLGLDPRARLSEKMQRRWARAGGRIVHVALRGAASAANAERHEDLTGALVTGAAPYGTCVVVRPDRTVLHDGPVTDAERIARESLDLLGAGTLGAASTRGAPGA